MALPAFISGDPTPDAPQAPVTGTIDPLTGKILPPQLLATKLQDAMGLKKAGADSSPVGSWTQGMARIADALMGGYEQNKLEGQYQQGVQQGTQQGGAFLGNLLGGGSAAGAQGGPPPAPASADGSTAAGGSGALPPPAPPGSGIPYGDTGAGPNGYGAINAAYKAPLDQPGEAGVLSPEAHYAFLKSQGATDQEALMLTGAAANESSFNPGAVHDNGNGYGLYGHNIQRLDMRGKNWQQQATAALGELRNTPQDAMVQSASNPEQLALAEVAYERPRGYTSRNPMGADNFTGRMNTIGYFGQLAGTPQGAPVASNTGAASPLAPPGTPGVAVDTNAPPAAPAVPGAPVQVASNNPTFAPAVPANPSGAGATPPQQFAPGSLTPDQALALANKGVNVPVSAVAQPGAAQGAPPVAAPSPVAAEGAPAPTPAAIPLPPVDPRTLPVQSLAGNGNLGGLPPAAAVAALPPSDAVAPAGNRAQAAVVPSTPGQLAIARAVAAGGANAAPPPAAPVSPGASIVQSALRSNGGAPALAPELTPGGQAVAGALPASTMQQFSALMANPYVPAEEKQMAANILSARLSPHGIDNVDAGDHILQVDKLTGQPLRSIPKANFQKITMPDGSERVLNMSDPAQAAMASGTAGPATQGVNAFPGQKLSPDMENYNAYLANEKARGTDPSKVQSFQDYSDTTRKASAQTVQFLGEGAEAKTAGEAAGTRRANMLAAADAAPGVMSRISLLRNVLQQTKTGPLAGILGQAGGLASAVGIGPDALKELGIDPNQATDTQIAEKLSNKMVTESIGAGKGIPASNFSIAERQFIEKMYPNMANQAGSNEAVSDVLMAEQQHAMDMADAWSGYKQAAKADGKTAAYEDFEDQWRQQHGKDNIFQPIIDKFNAGAYSNLGTQAPGIGPQTNAQGGAPAPNAANAGAPKDYPNARQAPDGHWYVKNPAYSSDPTTNQWFKVQ